MYCFVHKKYRFWAVVGIVMLIFTVILICCGASTKKAMIPVQEQEKIVQRELVEYVAGCAQNMAGDTENAEVRKAVCTAIHTDIWYLLQRMEAIPQKESGFVWEKPDHVWMDAAEWAADRIILYHGEPILAAYYKCGFGFCESAQQIWGEDIPYLISQKSMDMNDTKCRQKYQFEKEQLQQLFSKKAVDCSKVQVLSRSEAGRVLWVQIGEDKISGEMFADVLGLMSDIFTVCWNKDGLEVVCIGEGKCVGLSIRGAENLGQMGTDAESILQFYYPGTIVKPFDK